METRGINTKLQEKLAKRAKQLLIREINRSKGKTRIVNFIDYRLEKEARIIIEAPEYLHFIDKGRRPGKMPPIQAITKWAKLKGISSDLAWPIAVNIMKFGIKPTNVIQKAVRAFEQELPKIIEDDLVQRLEIELKNTIERK
jgi:hypothetical protein